jgi:hypothetical protein
MGLWFLKREKINFFGPGGIRTLDFWTGSAALANYAIEAFL